MTIFLDTETTGLDYEKDTKNITDFYDEVLQVGGLIVKNAPWENNTSDYSNTIIEPFALYCDTVKSHSQAAYNVHHIDIRQIRKYLEGEFLPKVLYENLPELFEDNVTLIGHNIMFDVNIVNRNVKDCYPFDFKKVTSNIFPKQAGHFAIDTVDFTKTQEYRKKLSALYKTHKDKIDQFAESIYMSKIRTNCYELFDARKESHDALFDSICVYVIWRDLLWKKKVF